jgi:predicted DNA-binding mobile mystery protein A
MNRFDDLRLRQLDSALRTVREVGSRPVPRGGWIRTIREALGMSLRQLATRAGLSKTATASIERNEAKGVARLESLHRLAEAMDCELVYAVVPRSSLRDVIGSEARRAAEQMVGRVADSMALEAQETSQPERERLVAELAGRLRANPSELWDV